MNRLIRILLRDKDTILLPMMLVAMTISFVPFITDEFSSFEKSKESVLLALVTVGAVMALVMVRFLSGTNLSSTKDEIYKYEIEHLRHELKAKFAKQTSPVSEEDEKIITDEILNRLNADANASYIDKLRDEIKASEYRLDIFKRGKSTLDRIYKEIDALGRRGTVNLVLGVITALSGVIALSFFVLAKEGTHSSLGDFAMEFLPRLSIVLIIEVFSYFFLRLYKASLAEIKYFQNEATNIEHNFVALEASISIDDKALIEKCIHKFLAVERNPIMTDGQTTREIIQESITSKETPISPDYLIKVIEAVRKSENA
ncbi:hypothetical protein [Marinomonas sp. FW-1]|uniref:hypothetical protein n=1 Tax=Marinomonas sp. FW-1 TaxID=2071621 RepID=UPI0010BF6F47|nr:hypothetical protein [Marinomonas sp. FW-1]